MNARVDYHMEKYQFIETRETQRLAQQWAEVMDECQQLKAGSEERLRIALLNVDYVTSFELPFRLQLIRAPQLIDRVRKELPLSRKPVTIGDSRYGCVYTVKTDLSAIPEEFRYRFSNRIRRVTAEGLTTATYQEIAKQVKAPRERLRLALKSGLQVTALDGMFWFGMQRIAADIATLRGTGMKIETDRIDVSDNLTGTTRRIPVYKLAD
ncbi:helix-turn-helix domain-containing protein [Scandinavium goeteborgense]|uniref:helix-turn-helix domain-containing protein n=1 Tax=Scandinavium goeteborgense TaxID=1851514 RepID=UPI002166B8EB|nr:helix-turn-helix domain-containing protein [Scandinavium goeteborgense]MCS2152186.1 helix-turn-helix domain-containing protein [Scandinavium goeteborgense]